jgi:hypothetical protein
LLGSATIGVAYEIAKGLKLGFEYSPSYSYIMHGIKLPEETNELKLKTSTGEKVLQGAVESVSIKSLQHNFALRLTWAL